MKSLLRTLSLLLSMLMLLSLFASCNKGKKPTESEVQSNDATQDTTVVEDPNSFMIFANGAYTAAFVMRENASSLDKAVANELSAALKEKTGTAPTFVNEAADGKTVFIGDVGVGQSEKINQTLRYGEAKIEISKNNMYICFTNREGGKKMISDLKNAISTDGATKVSREFTSSVTLSSEAVTLPAYTGGKQQTIDVGDDSTMLYISGTTLEEYEAYISTLEADGFKLYGYANTIETNHFATYIKNSQYAYAYFVEATKETRVILGPIDMLPESDDSNIYGNTVEPSMHMLGQPEHMNCGQGFIFVLPDGRLIVQDGGMNYTDNGIKDFAYNAIKKVAPDPDNIVIAAWFLSHPHDDHTDAFIEFVDNEHYKNIKIESVIYGFGETSTYQYTRGDGTKETSTCASNTRKAIDTLNAQGTKVIKAHTGQIFSYGNIQVEVLFTVEDILPGQYDYTNSTSMVIRLYFEEQSVLLLADTTHKSGAVLEKMWGSYLESTMVQIAHHGMWASNPSLYTTIDAEVLLWPNTTAGIKGWLTDNAVKAALEPAKDVLLADSGIVTIKLPYTIQNNKQAFLDAHK